MDISKVALEKILSVIIENVCFKQLATPPPPPVRGEW